MCVVIIMRSLLVVMFLIDTLPAQPSPVNVAMWQSCSMNETLSTIKYGCSHDDTWTHNSNLRGVSFKFVIEFCCQPITN